MNVSTSPQTVDTSAPATQSEMALSRAAIKKKDEINFLQGLKMEKHFVIEIEHMMFLILWINLFSLCFYLLTISNNSGSLIFI